MSSRENLLPEIDSKDPEAYDRIIIRGNPLERGISYGTQARPKILRTLQHYKSSPDFLPWPECVDFVRDNYLPAISKYYPKGLDEMKGIAKGAGVPLEDIIILNARYDLARVHRAQKSAKLKGAGGSNNSRNNGGQSEDNNQGVVNNGAKGESNEEEVAKDTPGECTGAVALRSATVNGEVILGQNWDINEFILKEDTAVLLEVHPDPAEHIQPFVMLAEPGQLGRCGMNSKGFGVIGMGLWSTGDLSVRDPEEFPYGWMPITLLRRMFLEAPTFSMGVRAIFTRPRHVSMSLILATAEDEALNIEMTPRHVFLNSVPLDKEILAHSNHFKSPDFLCRTDIQESTRGTSSLFRDRRLLRHLGSAWPEVSEDSFKTAFTDHVGWPNSVCEHPVPPELSRTSLFPKEATVASIIFNLSQRKLELCKGPPCQGKFQKYSLQKDLPPGVTHESKV